jgi:exodeoxyribonuclease V alpha subunit
VRRTKPLQKIEDSLSGVLQEIRFHKDSFLIGKLDGGASVKGNMVSPQIGMEYRFKGRWERHPRFGDTFIFSEYRASYPKELSAIRAYLMENCKWIGPEISKKLVNTFGEETLEACKSAPERVAKEIPGITQKRALEISAMLKNNEANEELQLELKRIVAGTRVSKRAVFKTIELYGQQAPEKIRENPYRLIEDIEGIGFLIADEIAQKVGFAKEGRPRIQAGIIHVLKESAFSSGHTCLPLEYLVSEAGKLLDVPEEKILDMVGRMVKDGHLVKTEDFIYLQSFYEAERSIARKLKELASRKAVPGNPQFDGLMEDQVDALGKAVENQVFILTGAPGTGKTYTIKKIIESFPDAKVSLAAPTGKAAKRIYEQSGMRARTIHKLLEPEKNGNGFYFTRNKDNPIDTDILILDEVSMVDTSLMASLMEAVAPDTRLIMVGDTYQLPSVGPGNILKDLIASEEIPTTELTIIKRQDEGLIIRNCHRIKNGEDIKLENSSARDFFFLPRDDEESIREAIFELITKRLKESYQADPLRDVQIISPLRERTSLSCKALNKACQEKLNKSPKIENCHFKVGDKVIQTKNEYEKDIINGDIGYIRSVNLKEKTIYVDFENPDRLVEIPLYENDLELAYAITVHKFQGSEAPIIIIPIYKGFYPGLMQRNLLYTAVSRARDVCILVGQRKEIPKIIRRNQAQRRFTNLARFLREDL